MQTRPETEGPTKTQLIEAIGGSDVLWNGTVEAIGQKFQPLDSEWKPSKLAFGWIHLLTHKKRTLLYMFPDKGRLMVSIVLGERAVGLAMDSSLPNPIKQMIAEARPYVEGRGIRFPVQSAADIQTVRDLVDIKTTPK
jgi:hypothetical protein